MLKGRLNLDVLLAWDLVREWKQAGNILADHVTKRLAIEKTTPKFIGGNTT